jgi:periplasmic divalent cation tolerance protein
MEYAVVLVTSGSADEAARISRTLVEERLAACVNIVPGLRSIYRWQGRIEEADEWLLVVKTARHALDRVVARVRSLHVYSVPEVVALPIDGGSAEYLRWLGEQVGLPQARQDGSGG